MVNLSRGLLNDDGRVVRSFFFSGLRLAVKLNIQTLRRKFNQASRTALIGLGKAAVHFEPVIVDR